MESGLGWGVSVKMLEIVSDGSEICGCAIEMRIVELLLESQLRPRCRGVGCGVRGDHLT